MECADPTRRRRCALPGALQTRLLLIALAAESAPASAATFFELRFHLIELRFLLSRQHRQLLLPKLKSRTHQLGLEACCFRQFLSSQRFIERTAFVRLTQLLSLCAQLFEQRLVRGREALANLLQLRFLIVSEIQTIEESVASAVTTTLQAFAMPTTATAFVALRVGFHRLRDGN